MRILQVSHTYSPYKNGVAEHVRRISEQLAREHAVTVFTCDPSGRLPREEKTNGVLVRRFQSFSPGDAYHVSFGMMVELRRSEFDVVHGHCYHALPLLFSRFARRKRFIATPHYHGHGHTRLRDCLLKLYKPFGGRVLREADKTIAVSNYERDLLIKDFKLDNARTVVIPSGIDLTDFNDLEKATREHKVILYVGRLERYKGVQYLIQALAALGEGIRLEIVGEGPRRERLMTLARALGVENRVAFYQDLPRRELLQRYVDADLFVMPSQLEAFGLAVAEALAAKTPCIVANSSALRDWVDDRNCFAIDYPIDSDQLADLIAKVIGTEVGDVKLWSWQEVVDEIVRVYGE